jgi:hypothetical protein
LRTFVYAAALVMPEPEWTADNPALLLMSRLSELIIDGLGK